MNPGDRALRTLESGEEVEHRPPELVGHGGVPELEDVGAVLPRVEQDDLCGRRGGTLDRRTERGRTAVELARRKELGNAHGPNLPRDRDAGVQIDPGQPDQPIGVQASGQRVHRLHRAEARTPDDDPARPVLSEQVDGVRQVLPAAVARVPVRASEVVSLGHTPRRSYVRTAYPWSASKAANPNHWD